MMKADDIECECSCCKQDIPIRSDEQLDAVWVSTLAFVAMEVIEIEDAESGVAFCSSCAAHAIGPDWQRLGEKGLLDKDPVAAAVRTLPAPHHSAWATLVEISRGRDGDGPMRTYWPTFGITEHFITSTGTTC
jgi:hypothetical protein